MASNGTLKAGWAEIDFTPATDAPLAGYAHLRERMATHVRDPLFARALVLEEGECRVLLLSFDLLMIPEDLYQGLRSRLADTGCRLVAHATHTHSAMGGFWNSFLARRFMGQYRPWALRHILDAGEQAARRALATMAPAQTRSASALLPGLNGNRRFPGGPVDEELTVLRVDRDDGEAVLASYSAHPVIVGERDHGAMSADFPGEVVRLLRRDFTFSMFVQGSLGGVDVLFPDDPTLSADRNLELMSDPLATSAAALARASMPTGGRLAFHNEEWGLGAPDPHMFHDDDTGKSLLDRVLHPIAASLVKDVPRKARVTGFGRGHFAMMGFQADLGVSVGLAAKELARKQGIVNPVSASQTNGYLGYIHLREDYLRTPPASHLGMARYENIMNFFGRDTGEHLVEGAGRVLGHLLPGR